MKYGQQFADTLSGTSESFQAASINYKKLKKSIKLIESELQSLGLNAELLKQLLSTDADTESVEGQSDKNHRPATRPRSGSAGSLGSRRSWRSAKSDGSRKDAVLTKKRKRRQPRARAEYVLAGTVENPIPRIKLVFSSASSDSGSASDEQDDHHDLYERLVAAESAQITEITDSTEDDEEEGGPTSDYQEQQQQHGVSTGDGATHMNGYKRVSSSATSIKSDGGRDPSMRMLMDKMYGLGVVPSDQVTSPGLSSPRRSPTSKQRQSSDLTTARMSRNTTNGSQAISSPAVQDADEGEEAVLYGPEVALDDEDGLCLSSADVVTASTTQRERAEDADAEGDAADETATIAETIRANRKKRRPRRARKEIVINIAYDSEFFVLLNKALFSLSALLEEEKASFKASVQALAKIVSESCSPSKNKSDLYVWREIFSLWVAAEIFESEREKDRGARAIEEIEKRLDWFVDQVGRRKLAKKMKKKGGREALERFVQLNNELLNVKRIGLANREAARKILKKHDKRLGLSASTDFPDFMHQQQALPDITGAKDVGMGSGASMALAKSALAKTAASEAFTTLSFAGFTTLPHILLANFTEVLLPIIPQIDDYSCIICGDIAWRPVALDCGHRFCIRCLVKMQKRGQDACPACRAPVVMKANKDNLDLALQEFQKRWFPKEIKAKEKDANKEIEKEMAQEMELDAKCIIA